jgi:hypothetical protein
LDLIITNGDAAGELLRHTISGAEVLPWRDRGLARADSFDRLVLWFEHDLYDQLQPLQIFDWFSRKEPRELLLVQASDFFGRQSEEEIEALRAEEQPVTAEQLTLAADAWAAFRAPTPEP